MAMHLADIKLAAWDEKDPRKTVIEVGSARIGATFTLVAGLEGAGEAGPALAAARAVKAAGAAAFRWAGAEAAGLAAAADVGRRAGLPVIIEVTDTKEVAPAAAAADVLMVGATNMQNFSLLKELGRSAAKPVLLVRGWHATLLEWLNSAEYVLFEGNLRVILCEAGIRSFETDARPILDLSAVPAVKAVSHLPIVVDIGRAGGPEEVEKMGLAAVAAGADGLVVEVAVGGPAAASPAPAKPLSLAAFARLAPKLAAMSRLTKGLAIDHD
jgi:3-deoxy-7-phosphoheptulonate synthase